MGKPMRTVPPGFAPVEPGEQWLCSRHPEQQAIATEEDAAYCQECLEWTLQMRETKRRRKVEEAIDAAWEGPRYG